jgi:hypothetical protein
MSSTWAQNSTLHASNMLSCQNYTPKLMKNHGTEFSGVGTGTQRHSELSCSDNFPFRRAFLFSATAPQLASASSFTRILDHTQRRTTVGRTPPGE